MSKKNKEHYLNLDKNQLADKGKTKLHYEESCKEAAKRYSESKKHEKDCKISKGIIKNINKNLLTGTLIILLSSSTLTGCKAYGFTYENNNEGIRYATGTVDNNYIEDCYYIEIDNPKFQNVESYITVKQNEYGKIKYFDIFTLDTIYIENDENFEKLDVINVISVNKYLEEHNIEKKKYDVEFMKELLGQMGTERNKQLVK